MTRHIVLFGNSLFLAGIEAGLRGIANVNLMRIDDRASDAAQTVRACDPDTIVFDASGATPACLVPLLQELPHLVLIGVDPSKDSALVLSSRQPVVMNLRDLTQLILHK